MSCKASVLEAVPAESLKIFSSRVFSGSKLISSHPVGRVAGNPSCSGIPPSTPRPADGSHDADHSRFQTPEIIENC